MTLQELDNLFATTISILDLHKQAHQQGIFLAGIEVCSVLPRLGMDQALVNSATKALSDLQKAGDDGTADSFRHTVETMRQRKLFLRLLDLFVQPAPSSDEKPGAHLTFNEYQTKARETAIYPQQAAVVYPLLGLAGEMGELIEKALFYIFPMGPSIARPIESEINTVLDNLVLVAKQCEILKKVIRDNKLADGALDGIPPRVAALTQDEETALLKEASDNFWYLAALLHDLGYSMGEVGQMNLDKLAGRKQRGTLTGSGDSR